MDNLSDVASSEEGEEDVPNQCLSQFTKVNIPPLLPDQGFYICSSYLTACLDLIFSSLLVGMPASVALSPIPNWPLQVLPRTNGRLICISCVSNMLSLCDFRRAME